MKRHRGAGPGFDFWRFGLSTLIIFLHSFHVSYGILAPPSIAIGRNLRPLFAGILPVFFGLSGFLVAGSALRTTKLHVFLGFRVLRLVPALSMEVMLSALLLGPALTQLPLPVYFTNKHFFAYFGNIVGLVRFELPGVFTSNPLPYSINLNLWTLHAELLCYALMAVAILVGLLKRRKLTLLAWVLATAAFAIMNVLTNAFEPTALYPQSIWVYSFCSGVVAFLWRDRVPLSGPLAAVCALVYAVLVYIPHTVFVAIPLLIYIMIYIGMQPRLAFRWFKRGDYSYGLYLYGFVIQQSIVFLVPNARQWWIVFPCAWLMTILFAAASWHIVEKPALRLKRFLAPRSSSILSLTEPPPVRQPGA